MWITGSSETGKGFLGDNLNSAVQSDFVDDFVDIPFEGENETECRIKNTTSTIRHPVLFPFCVEVC